jgi:mRNA-degrading endonuclease RelE of RelBE toxin-antitoxin system
MIMTTIRDMSKQSLVAGRQGTIAGRQGGYVLVYEFSPRQAVSPARRPFP